MILKKRCKQHWNQPIKAGISILTGQESTYKSHPKDYFVIRSFELQVKW